MILSCAPSNVQRKVTSVDKTYILLICYTKRNNLIVKSFVFNPLFLRRFIYFDHISPCLNFQFIPPVG